MGIILIVLGVIGGAALAAYIHSAPNVPIWVKHLLNVLLGLIVVAGICFAIFVIMGIVAHI